MEKFKLLITEEQLQERMKELAKQIEKDYEGREITVICVMNGAIFFTVELTLKIKNPMTYEFIRLSSYEGTESTGNIVLKNDIEHSIEGKDVLIIEDIIDTGRTIQFLREHIEKKNPKSVKVCVLTNREGRREIELKPAEYVGFEIPNHYVVGYGFDIGGKYRNMPYVAYVED